MPWISISIWDTCGGVAVYEHTDSESGGVGV